MATHKWSDVKYRGKLSRDEVDKVVRRARVEAAEMTLRELREALDVTQDRLAEIMNMAQSEVSRLERREDWRLSTLRRVVEALGGKLEVAATFPDRRVVLAEPTAAAASGRGDT